MLPQTNIIHKLYNEEFVKELFKEKVLSEYPEFKSIEKIKIIEHKNGIWERTYHVVLEFETTFETKTNQTATLPIFCSAHSEEPRENLYKALKYLWNNGFKDGDFTVPHPLFYSNTFKATFYRGAEGKNFYRYIRDNERETVEELIKKTALWFAKLHNLPADSIFDFNEEISRIKTVIPGRDEIIRLIGCRYSRHKRTFEKIYDYFIKKEEEFLKSTDERWLVHGDAHPENVIKMGENKIAMIDLNDICLSDFARDLGCFLQQFEFMAMRKIGDIEFVNKMKKLFLDTYLKERNIEMDDGLEERIDNYYNWTAIRTAIFFLLKSGPESERAFPIIDKIKNKIW